MEVVIRPRLLPNGFALLRVTLCAVTLAWACPRAALAEPTEAEVKAALIFNLPHFVEWPATSYDSPTTPFLVAILGQDDVSAALEPMLLRKSIEGHPLIVRRVHTADEARKCQMLYVARSEKKHVDAILLTLHGASTLTVSDLDQFADRGGHINVVLEDQRVRMIVNRTSAEDSHLKISARLLALARIVIGTP